MRRISAISLIAVLTCSMSLPLMAAAGGQEAGKAMLCHREAHRALPAHHCHDMQSEDEEASPDSDITISSAAEKCPMNCCKHSTLIGGTAMAAPGILPPQLTVEKDLHFFTPVFSRNGFSSHTDRGPPAA